MCTFGYAYKVWLFPRKEVIPDIVDLCRDCRSETMLSNVLQYLSGPEKSTENQEEFFFFLLY